jgi:aryl-alcohol dehydrogenase-like predicted oxidoreductase
LLAYSPLAPGKLTEKYCPDSSEKLTGARSSDPQFSEAGLEKIESVVALLRKIGYLRDRTPAQVALNWLIAQGNAVAISGTKTTQQVQQNAGSLGWKLTDDVKIAELEQISRPWLH